MLRYNGTDGSIVTGTQLIHEWVHHLCRNGWHIADGSRGKPSYKANRQTLQAAQDFFTLNDDSLIPYGTDSLGEPTYRARAALGLQQQYNINFSANNIAFTPGGQFGLFASFSLLHQRQPHGKFVSTIPGYLNYLELIQYATKTSGTEALLPVTLDKKNNYQLNASTLKAALKDNTAPISAFIFCNPVNPTGQVLTKEQWSDIADILRSYDAPIILDEAFGEIIFSGEYNHSLINIAPDLVDRIFLFRSGTKAIGFSGERLAVTVVPSPYIEEFRYIQSRLLGNPPLSGQAAMAEALVAMNNTAKNELSHFYQRHATQLTALLDELGIHYIAPEGGFYLLADLSCCFGQPISEDAREALSLNDTHINNDVDCALSLLFGHNKLTKQGIAIIPGSFFGLDTKQGMVRISFSPSHQEITKLGEFLSVMLAP